MDWNVLAVLSLCLAIFGPIRLWSKYGKKGRREELGDTEEFRQQLAEWEPIVLEVGGTLRSVKRFANQARFLAADHDAKDMLPQLVGFSALQEVNLHIDIFKVHNTPIFEEASTWSEAQMENLDDSWSEPMSPETQEELDRDMAREEWDRKRWESGCPGLGNLPQSAQLTIVQWAEITRGEHQKRYRNLASGVQFRDDEQDGSVAPTPDNPPNKYAEQV